MGIGLACKVFFKCIGQNEFSQKVQELLQPETKNVPAPEKKQEDKKEENKKPDQIETPTKPKGRSDALTLLAILQREARLIDFLKEDITSLEDEQIGAAVRDVHKKSAEVLQKIFNIDSFLKEEEGSQISVPTGFDPAQYQLSGNVSGAGPFKGQLEHGGWKANRTDLPSWKGDEASTLIICPAEVEVR